MREPSRSALGNRTVTEDFHLVVRRDETCGHERVDRDLGERLLGCQLLERREVDSLNSTRFRLVKPNLGRRR